MSELKNCVTCGCILADDPTLSWPSDYDKAWFEDHPDEIEYTRKAMPREHPWCDGKFRFITVKKMADKIRMRIAHNVDGTLTQRMTRDQ